MLAGNIVIGVIAGCAGTAVLVALGMSWWFVIFSYSAIGTVTTLLSLFATCAIREALSVSGEETAAVAIRVPVSRH